MSTDARGSIVKHVLVAAAALAAIAVLTVLAAPYISRARVEHLVREAGAWGPLALILVQVLQIVLAPIPGVLVPLLAGAFYGPWAGVLIIVTGSALGSSFAFGIGRRAGLPLVRRWFGAKRAEQAERLLNGKGWIALAVIFLVPFTPSDVICFIAGMIGMPLRRFIPAVLLGRIPKDAALALAGAGLMTLGKVAPWSR